MVKLRGNPTHEERTMTKETDSYSYEITLRAVGQALEALGVESFELVLDGDNFVVYGGPESTLAKQKLQQRVAFDCLDATEAKP